MKWWLLAIAGMGALMVVVSGPFLVWLILTSLEMGGPPRPPDRFDHGTFSTFGIAMMQAMLTMMIIIIAVTALMGYRGIKNAAVESAGSVAISRVDEELKRRFGNGTSPTSPSASSPGGVPKIAVTEKEDETDAPS